MRIQQLVAISSVLTLLTGMASAQTQTLTTNLSYSVNKTVPDGNPVGLTLAENVSGLSGVISNVTVSLDLAGGFNGDLYAYLLAPSGGMAVLLNRVGISGSSGNSVGYNDSGFNITLDDAAATAGDIHFYQNVGYTLNGSGQLTGTWQSDARNIDPQSAPAAFDTAARGSSLLTLNRTNPNGTWTLFLADMSSGAQSSLINWGLNIAVVPEPSTLALTCLGLTLTLIIVCRRNRQQCSLNQEEQIG